MANPKIMMADTIMRFAKDYESMVKAAAFLKEIGTNEQIADELKAAADAAANEAEVAKDELAAAKAAVKAQKAKCAEMQDAAEEQAKEVIKAANVEASMIVAGGKGEAQEIVAAANKQAAEAVGAIAGRVAEARKSRDELVDEIHQLEAKLYEKTVETENIESRLAKAQASIAKLLG